VVIFFRDKSIVAVVFLVALCLLVHFHFFITPAQVTVSDDDGILSILLARYIQPLPSTFLFIIYITLILVQAVRLDLVLNEIKMFQQTGFTTAMSYVLLSGFIPQWCSVTPALVANLLVIWIFVKLSKLYNNPSPKTLLFNTGLVVGLTVLSYHPTALLVPVVLFALMVVRPFKLTEWFVLLMGIITPYYFLLSVLFLTDKMSLIERFTPELLFNLPLQHADVWLWINLSALLLLLLVGFYFWSPANNRMVIQLRKNWGVMMVLLLILLPVSFIFKKAGIESAMLIIVPFAAFVSNAFLNPKKLLLPNLLFWIALAIIIHNDWELIKL